MFIMCIHNHCSNSLTEKKKNLSFFKNISNTKTHVFYDNIKIFHIAVDH